jgi:hypothetical protein
MPTVAIIDGVRIVFYAKEHPPPHFHAKIGEHQAVIDIDTLEVVAGSLPRGKRKKVLAWAAERQEILHATFSKAIAREPVEPIE